MRSPDFCCPRCGGRDWWQAKEGWVCRHSAPSAEFADFRPWLAYQVEAEEQTRGLLLDWKSRQRAKLQAGMAALVETTEIARYQVRLDVIIANVRLGVLLEALAEGYPSGRIELGKPPLRFFWSSTLP